ncbi:hypothetical protein PRBEI_2000646700 [Prionailurus iriomotensis]
MEKKDELVKTTVIKEKSQLQIKTSYPDLKMESMEERRPGSSKAYVPAQKWHRESICNINQVGLDLDILV